MKSILCARIDGKPHYSMTLPPNARFVGMEKEPNKPPRYGTIVMRGFNLPCYELSAALAPGGEP